MTDQPTLKQRAVIVAAVAMVLLFRTAGVPIPGTAQALVCNHDCLVTHQAPVGPFLWGTSRLPCIRRHWLTYTCPVTGRDAATAAPTSGAASQPR